MPLLIVLVATTLISQNLASQELLEDRVHYEYVVHSVTPVGRVRATITKIKPRIQVARVYQPVVHLLLNDDDTDYYDELPEIQVGYRRPELVNQSAGVDLPDEIKLRLALARLKALQKYNEVWG